MSFAPWIKVEVTTPDKPEVVAMQTRLGLKDHDTVVGKLVRLWAWADANSVDGQAVKITRAWIDGYVRLKGFAAALEAEDWLSGPDGAITFPNFERHNGDSAKKRAVETRKKQNQRAGGKGGGDKGPPGKGTNVPVASGQKGGLEEEGDKKERESVREAQGNFSDPPETGTLDRRVLIRSMRREWGASEVFSDKEERLFEANRAAIYGFDEDDWRRMARFMAVKFPEGNPAWQPRYRWVFIESITEVAAAALAWEIKRAGREPEPRKLAVVTGGEEPGEVATDEEMKAILSMWKRGA